MFWCIQGQGHKYTDLKIIFSIKPFLPSKIFVSADFEFFNTENKTYKVNVFYDIIIKFQHTELAACFFDDFLQFCDSESIITTYVTQLHIYICL